MPRPKSNPSPSPLSPGQAAYVLDQLIKERRVSQGEISRYVSDMGREITDLEARLQRLREAHGGSSSSSSASAAAPAAARRGPGRPPGGGAKGPGRRPGRPGRPPGRPAAAAPAAAAANAAGNKGGAKKGGRKSAAAITAEQLASRQLQGRYLSLVRQFPEKKRGDYAKIAKEKGREAAIKAMQDDRK
ncbi:MAG TPA: hypothetical protein VHW00_16055 [Thermoanaerobaculia bacterium]|nr:hypothetical protein [Thermoanaerobaculia bacterium]